MTETRDGARRGPIDPAQERITTEGPVYTVTGGDWDSLIDEEHDDRIVVNMGPQHPSTHGVLRLVLELEGETVTQARSVIGYLHTGIEKNCEYRTWTQGVTFVTRADYLSPLFSETAYCLGVEKLLGIEAPRRAQQGRVMLMEICRIASHLVCLATGGMELGALTGMTNGFREREDLLHLLERLTGLRMNHAFIRPGGLAQDFPDGFEEDVLAVVKQIRGQLPGYDKLLTGQPIWQKRLENVGYLPLDGCLALGATGPILRSAGLPWDLRKVEPYCGYEQYDFKAIVPPFPEAPSEAVIGDAWHRFYVRMLELVESIKIVEQGLRRYPSAQGSHRIEPPRHLPAGEAYVETECPRGQMGFYVVGRATKDPVPFRVRARSSSFSNLSVTNEICRGCLIADVPAIVGSIDIVMGEIDR